MSRILVIKLSSFGDLFHALPVVRALKDGLEATVDWVTHDVYVDVVRCFDDVEQVLAFPRKRFPLRAHTLYRALWRERYDLAVDLQGLLKSAFLVGRMARAGRRAGPLVHREGAGFFYDVMPPPADRARHAVDQLLDLVPALGLPRVEEPAFPVTFPEAQLEGDGPHVGFVPRSRWPAKDWSPAHFAEVGRRLQDEAGATLHLCGGPGDRAACSEIASGVGERVVNHCGQTRLAELGGLLRAMDLVVSVDSGPMHMAAALGTPVLAVFGATDPGRTGPYGRPHRVVMAPELREHPELARSFKNPKLAGTWHVDADEVARNALEMLG